MLSMWQTPPGLEQLQKTLVLYNGLESSFGVFQLGSLMHGSTLNFQSFFPNCPAISLRASTAPSILSN
jgi:hypothetical protein